MDHDNNVPASCNLLIICYLYCPVHADPALLLPSKFTLAAPARSVLGPTGPANPNGSAAQLGTTFWAQPGREGQGQKVGWG